MKIKVYKYDEIETVKELSNKKINSFYVILVYFILTIIISFLVWSYFGKIDLKIKGTGTLETKVDSSVIVNVMTGKVKNNNISQGKKVNKGDLLYEIENNSLSIEKNYLEKSLAEKKNLYNAISSGKYNKDTSVSNYLSKRQAHQSELDSLNIEIEEQERTVYTNSELYKVGGLSRFDYEKSQNQLSILKERKKKLEIEYQISKNSEKITLNNEIKELEMKIKSMNDSIKGTKVVASISGYLEVMTPINNGDTVASDINIAKIIPSENDYKINIYVEEKDITKIKKGNNINYHLNFPDEKKNISLKGKIELISRDSIMREDGNKYYLVVGNIDAKNVNTLNLKKGMTLESSIIYTKKRIIDYILEILSFKVKTLE